MSRPNQTRRFAKPRKPKHPTSLLMQAVVSGGLLVAALIVILIPSFDGPAKHWAYGLTGTILGFWLKK